MVEVSADIGLGEEEIELDLGLSIGGSFRRAVKPRTDLKPDGGFQSDHLLGHSLQHDGKQRKKRWMMMRDECDEAEEQQRGGMFKRDRVSGPDGSVVQNVGFNNNGFAFPCWSPFGNDEKNVAGSLATACIRGFQPYLVHSNGGGGLVENDERDDGVNASSMCSSSVVLEQQSSSHEGGGSSDSHSHSAHSTLEPTLVKSSKKENDTRSQPEQSASSHLLVSEQQHKMEKRNNIGKEMQPNISCPPTKLKEEPTINSKTVPIVKPMSNEDSSSGALKKTKSDMRRPPKPPSLAQMPYVSTTGNGPNGKTVNGFLYKYTSSEVSIVCVCHGSTFSPAEFVQHAGGTDISHPLRHITVIPSASG